MDDKGINSLGPGSQPKGTDTKPFCTSWLHAGQLLGQRSSIGAHIQEGPIWLEEPQVAQAEGFERAFEIRAPDPIKHCLRETCRGGCTVPVDGSCDIPPHGAKDEDQLWVPPLRGDLQEERLGPFLTANMVGPTAPSTSATSGAREGQRVRLSCGDWPPPHLESHFGQSQ